MADEAPAGGRGGFRGGFGDRGRGRGRGRRGGRGRGRGGKEDKEWVPVTKLGRLVKDGKIKTLEEIYMFSLPIKVITININVIHYLYIHKSFMLNYQSYVNLTYMGIK